MKKYAVIESTEEIEVGLPGDDVYIKIRVWLDEEEVSSSYDNRKLVKSIEDFADPWKDEPASMKEIAEFVAGLERINAVQVIDLYDNSGVMIYTNW